MVWGGLRGFGGVLVVWVGWGDFGWFWGKLERFALSWNGLSGWGGVVVTWNYLG